MTQIPLHQSDEERKKPKIKFLVSDEEYGRTAKNQKQYILKIAAKMKAGNSLTQMETEFAIAVLKGAAAGISEKQPKERRRPPKICPGEVAMLYGLYQKTTDAKPDAIYKKIAAQFGIKNKQTIGRIVRENMDMVDIVVKGLAHIKIGKR